MFCAWKPYSSAYRTGKVAGCLGLRVEFLSAETHAGPESLYERVRSGRASDTFHSIEGRRSVMSSTVTLGAGSVPTRLPYFVVLTLIALPLKVSLLHRAGLNTSSSVSLLQSPVSARVLPSREAERTRYGPVTRTIWSNGECGSLDNSGCQALYAVLLSMSTTFRPLSKVSTVLPSFCKKLTMRPSFALWNFTSSHPKHFATLPFFTPRR